MSKVLNFEKKGKKGTKTQTGKFEIKNFTGDSADLYMYGYIASDKWWEDDIVPQDIKEFLDEIKDVKKLNVYINSGGGSVFAGMAIYNMLHRFEAETIVYVDGLAASIASVIAFCGDKLVIPSNAYLMIHKPMTGIWGNSDELLEMADVLDKIQEGMMNVYKANLADGVDIATIEAFVNEEKWFTGEEAADYFNIETTEANEAVAYCDVEGFINAPEAIVKNEADQLEVEKARLKLAYDIAKSK